MSLHFSHANFVETGRGGNVEKLVEASSTKRALLRKNVIEAKLLGKLVPRRPFPTSFGLPRSIFSGDPRKFVMQIDFQRSVSSCVHRQELSQRILLLLHRLFPHVFLRTFTTMRISSYQIINTKET